MNQSELLLWCAISQADIGGGDRPTADQRRRAALAVFTEWVNLTGDSAFPFTIDEIEQASLRLRKAGDPGKVKVGIALTHGIYCYFRNRGKGPCCNEVEAGHIWQKWDGGPLTIENGQIECKAHNNQRRELSIEEYMKSDKKTEATDGR
jgi:hypothetical protein